METQKSTIEARVLRARGFQNAAGIRISIAQLIVKLTWSMDMSGKFEVYKSNFLYI